MTRHVLLVEIGGKSLPNITPVQRPASNWVPSVKPGVVIPPAEGVETTPGADSVTITWEASPLPGAVYVVWRAPDVNGKPGAWEFVTRTSDTRYTYADVSGAISWWKITVLVNGISSGDSTAAPVAPVVPPTTQELVDIQRELDRGLLDLALADAREAEQRATGIAAAQAEIVALRAQQGAAIIDVLDKVSEEASKRAQALLNEKLEREAAVTAESDARQSDVESLARAMSEVAAGSGTQFDSKSIWHFTTGVEGWGSNGGAPAINDGWLRPFNNSSSYAQSPVDLAVDGNAYRFIKLRMRRVGSPLWLGLVRWTTDADQIWDDAKSKVIAEPAFDAAGVATVDISDIAWGGPSPIRQVRVALTRAQSAINYVEYDYIAIGRPAPGASVALVQQQAQAQTTALAAEASQRNDLAVQMRGNYTGTDLSKVTTGFMAEERSARVAADSSQVKRLDTMEARMPAGSGGLATSASVTSLQDTMAAADQANAQATTAVNSKLSGLRMTGDNIVPNSNFATGMEWWARAVGPAGNSIEWGAASGDGGPGVVIGRGSAASSPWIAANEAAWQPVKAPRRFRAIFKARAVGTGGNVLMRQHVRDAALVEGVSDVTVAVTNTAWQRYTVDWSEVGSTRIEARFTAYVTTVGATVAFDRIEIYDVTDLVANELTASGLQALTTRTSSIEGAQTAQATLIGQVQSGLSQTNGNVTAAQQAAQAAADAAGAKGKVIYGSASPSVADRLPQNLWIDSTGNANTPKRWNGTAWAAVSDKVATDAAAAAAAAQQTANAAQTQASANAGALSTLDTKVTQQGAALTAQGDAITAVNIRADGLETGLANVGGDNLLGNSSFEAETNTPAAVPGWSNNSGGLGSGVTRRQWADSTLPGSARAWRWELDNVPTSGYLEGISNSGVRLIKVEAGKAHTVSAYVRGTAGFRVLLQFAWRNAANSTISYSGTPSAAQYRTSEDWSRISWTSVAPALATSCVVYIRVYGANAAGQWVEWDNVQVQVGSVATGYAPSAAETAASLAANVNATNTLTGKVSSLEGTTSALSQAATTVNAKLSSLGDVVSYSITANAQISSAPSGGPRTTAIRNASGGAVAGAGRGFSVCLINSDSTLGPRNGFDTYNSPSVAGQALADFIAGIPENQYFIVYTSDNVGNMLGGSAGASAAQAALVDAGGTSRAVSALQGSRMYILVGRRKLRAGSGMEILCPAPTSGRADQWCEYNLQVLNGVPIGMTDQRAMQQAMDATSQGLSAITATVEQQAGQVTALGQQVQQVGAGIANKADSSVVQTLTAMVKDTLSGGGNLLSNTLFKDGRRGWGWWNSGNGTWNELGLVAGPEWAPPGLAHFGGFAPSNLALNTQFWAGDEQPVPVVAGKRYCFSAYINCHRVGLALLISFRDANGNTVGEQYSGPADATNVRPPITLDRMKRLSASMVAPASAVYARVGFYLRGLGLSNNEGNYFWIFQPMLEEMREGQTGPSPYSAGGGETLAGYSLYVTADGLTGGMVTKNDGKVVDMKILADVLQILSPNKPDGIEMRDGYIRTWKGNSQRIIGNGFGNPGEGLMDYFGPNVGAAAASKANATVWMDVNGNAYWGGALAAGVLRNAVQTTTTTTVGSSVTTGLFSTNGRNKSVVISFSRNHNRRYTAMGNTGFVAGGGANTCTVNVYRTINGQAEQFWQQFTAGGSVTIFNEWDGPDDSTSYWSGSITINDNGDGSAQRSYRAEIVGFTAQDVSHSSGSFNQQTITQSLSIVSTEI